MIVISNPEYSGRAEILREKGTNRSAFFRGEVDKYSWVDIGSSFLPSDIIAAFLYAQLENIDDIQARRISLWNRYKNQLIGLENQGFINTPSVPEFATQNGHMFYVVCRNLDERTRLAEHLRKDGIYAVFHYLSLHSAPYFQANHDGRPLTESDRFTDCLLRLPLFYELEESQVDLICESISRFYTA
jgi:dTDP-4-amino-4,6-dideoxygalactose transaminase